jgi:capsular exopolysaccharide synthesis family protein
MEQARNIINPTSSQGEGIDLDKLRATVRTNAWWIGLIFISINLVTYLITRYTQDRYESYSEIKLEVKDEASELGINKLTGMDAQSTDLIAGEIEILRSRLFLDRVLDSLDLSVSYFSKGEVLNHELFANSPVNVTYAGDGQTLYNQPFFLERESSETFSLVWGETNRVSGHYGKPMALPGLEITLWKNANFSMTEDIDLFFIIHSHDVLLNYLSGGLSIDALSYSAKTIRVAFQDMNAQKAQAIVHTIDNLYVQYTQEQKKLANKQKITWLNNELQQIELKMEGYEDYFKKFTLQNKSSDLEDDLRKTIGTLSKIDSQRYELSRRIQEVNGLMEDFKSDKAAISPALRQLMPEYVYKEVDAVQTLMLQQEKLKLSYNDNTLAYREKQREIDTRMSKAFRQLNDLKTEWMKSLQRINQQKKFLEGEFVNMPDKNTQFSKNQRFYKLYEEFYLSLMQTKSGFEIAQAGTTPDFKILSPASMPSRPISPNRLMILGVGFVGSVTIIIFFIGVIYLLNNKITNLYELERLGEVPVLGVVPSSRYSGSDALQVVTHPKSMVSEAIRTLRTNLDFFRVSGPNRVIAISSTISGEGKSFLALNLGAAIALSRKKVLLIDLDMRKNKTNLPVNVANPSSGTSTILIKKDVWQDCVIQTDVEFLDYISSGPIPPNPSELLLNGEFSSLLEELKQHYHTIILDTPPVGLVTDGIQAMKRADISIYILRANYSKRDFLQNLKRIVSINKIANVTSVLNALPSGNRKSYGYGYGYYEDEGGGNVQKIKSLLKKRP